MGTVDAEGRQHVARGWIEGNGKAVGRQQVEVTVEAHAPPFTDPSRERYVVELGILADTEPRYSGRLER